MNEIFIILNNEYSFVELIFENFKNELIFENKIFKFDFIDKNKLKIYNLDESFILETVDSFIFTDNISSLSFKLITLNHEDWFDQAIIDYNNNTIIRIRDRNQFGTFKLDNNKLKIIWDFWGEEFFELYDEYIYNHICLKRHDLKQNIIVFIHLCNLGDGYNIFLNQYARLKKSNIYDNIKKIYICLLGKYEDKIKQDINKDKNIEILHLNEDVKYYEFLTINKIKEFVDNNEEKYNILYFHNKGTRNAGNKSVTESWREMMEYFLIDNGTHCINSLDYYDTIGCNILNKNEELISNISNKHCYHYSGNFWWSKSEHIKTLDILDVMKTKEEREKKRFQCENWLLSNINSVDNSTNKNIGVIYQDNTNIHPYHRFIFENYKNKKILIKKLKLS